MSKAECLTFSLRISSSLAFRHRTHCIIPSNVSKDTLSLLHLARELVSRPCLHMRTLRQTPLGSQANCHRSAPTTDLAATPTTTTLNKCDQHTMRHAGTCLSVWWCRISQSG